MALARKTINDGGVVIHVATNDALARGTSLPQAANDNENDMAHLAQMAHELQKGLTMLLGHLRARGIEVPAPAVEQDLGASITALANER
jgi:hypothetical protein